MAGMRSYKQTLKKLLSQSDWQEHLDQIADNGMTAVGPLFSFLLADPLLMHRAAAALGHTIARIFQKNPEQARNIIRRFMWHMNEDSGNIGWGIPEAFAETLATSTPLAKEYKNILASYIMDLGHADNYCDNDILRRSCFWAVGRLAQSNPDLMEQARPWLIKGLKDNDAICQGMAAWALGQIRPDFSDAPALRTLKDSDNNEDCAIYEHGQMEHATARELAARALAQDQKKS